MKLKNKKTGEIIDFQPIHIDSALVSAQCRQRYYWSNWEMSAPEDKGIVLTDILETKDNLNKGCIIGRRLNENGKRDDYNKDIPIIQCLEIRATNRDKCNCLTTVSKDNVLSSLPVGRHPGAYTERLPYRNYTKKELCRLQTLSDDYFPDDAKFNSVQKAVGNGWTVDVIAHLFRGT